MRIVAGCLQTYFYIRGVVDHPQNPINSVEFFSPKHKLKCYTGPALDISRNGKVVKGKYAQTKKMGIEIARVKLEEYNQTGWIDFFEKEFNKPVDIGYFSSIKASIMQSIEKDLHYA